jgi:uncharacterized FAD-dependent dehydrogenase
MIHLVLELDLIPGQGEDRLEALASKRFHGDLKLHKILKKSIDARKKDRVVTKYRAVFGASEKDRERLVRQGATVWVPEAAERPSPASNRPRVVIVGTGPAGLFCALRLAERGVWCTVLEQGKAVEDRHRDIDRLRADGTLDPFSNVVFGEGGAGTYSDGKLTTRIHKPGITWVFDKLVDHGAPESVLYEAKPHVGTDVLSTVVASIRRQLTARGTKVLFGKRVTELVVHQGRVAGVRTDGGEEFAADAVVLACGHSARDLYTALAASGVPLERKGFAVGVRIEHPAGFINRAQYGSFADRLPAADYRLTWNNPSTGRGTYSFCMCPGGEVVNSSSEPGLLCVNGMSYSQRDLPRSNAALVTTVTPEDGPEGALGGIEFQRGLERAAFAAGGGAQGAPASSARAFFDRKPSARLPETSYEPRVVTADFDAILPPFLAAELRLALAEFDRKVPGFLDQGTLIGVETRTSSPVRISRGEDLESTGIKGLYPAGEGAGYAGGIVSSAVDGVRIADRLCTGA